MANVPAPQKNGLEEILGKIVVRDNDNEHSKKGNQFFIPWSDAFDRFYSLLEKEYKVRENDYYWKLKPTEWNACIYIHSVSPATPFK